MKDLRVTIEDHLKDSVTGKRDAFGRLIDKYVLSEPVGPKRWRAAVKLWLALEDMYVDEGMTASQINDAVIKQNRAKRELLLNDFAKSDDKNSDMRETLNMPFGANLFIKLVDPTFFSKDNIPKLMREFPEYVIAQRY